MLPDFRKPLAYLVLIVCVLLVTYAQRAAADHNAAVGMLSETNYVTIYEAPCTEPKVLLQILERHHARFKAATVRWDGQTLAACWATTENPEYIYIIDETGDHGPLPLAIFKPHKATSK
jgi:hypothetical protein